MDVEVPNGVKVDPPPHLPAGWVTFKLQHKSGKSVGQSYYRFFNEKHRSVENIRKCIEIDAQDKGEDVEKALREYDEAVRKEQSGEEALESFDPQMSGLSQAALAVLPPDAAPGHAAWKSVNRAFDSYSHARASFFFTGSAGKKEHFQVTHKAVCDNLYAMFRIARACYVKVYDDSFNKDAAIKFRNECISKLKAECGAAASEPAAKRRKVNADKKTAVESVIKHDANNDGQKEEFTQAMAKTNDQQQDNNAEEKEDKSDDKDKRDNNNKKDKQPRQSKANAITQIKKEREKKEPEAMEANSKKEDKIADVAEQKYGGIVVDNTAETSPKMLKSEAVSDAAASKDPVKKSTDDVIAESMPDAPVGHVAHELSARWENADHRGAPVIAFYAKCPSIEGKFFFQLGLSRVGGNREAALKISRACYALATGGASKDDVLQFRADCFSAWKQAKAGEFTAAQVAKKRMKEPTAQPTRADAVKVEPKKEEVKEDDSLEDSSSELSPSDNDDDKGADVAGAVETKVAGKRKACAKMLVRVGYRCAWNYMKRMSSSK